MEITELISTVALEKFNISAVKPYQMLVIHRILENDEDAGDDCCGQVVILPTGTGKSLCFLLPALLCKGLTVIVYPLLALMNDQVKKLRENGIPCADIRGGQTKTQRKEIFEQIEKGRVRIVVTNPETLLQESVLKTLKQFKISLFVCDEAHLIVKWKDEFRPAYGKLKEVASELHPGQVLAFTATAGNETLSVIKKYLFEKDPITVRGDADRENIEYNAFAAVDRVGGVVEILKTCEKPVLVFCRTRAETYNVCLSIARILKTRKVRYYHAGLSKNERLNLEKWFLESKDGILCATSAYGTGVDKPDVRTVIHYSLPDDIEEYLQESGRAGRDGETSVSYAIITPTDRNNAKKSKVVSVFTGNDCRRHTLLVSLGQEKNECTGCDVCNGKVKTVSEEEKYILRLIRRYPFRFTSTTAADLLCGQRNEDNLNPLFGRLNYMDRTITEQSVRQLEGYGIRTLRYKNSGYLYAEKKTVTIVATVFQKILKLYQFFFPKSDL